MSASDGYKYALKLLSKRNYFVEELRAAILKRYPDEDPEPAIQSLKEDRYLDDERQLTAFVRWKTVSGYGPRYIKEKLRGKGINVSSQEIADILESEELDSQEIVRQAVRKYIKSRKKKDSQALIQGCLNHLNYRGFNISDVFGIVKNEIAE